MFMFYWSLFMLAYALLMWRYRWGDWYAEWMGFTPNLWYYLIPVLATSAFSMFVLATVLGAFD